MTNSDADSPYAQQISLIADAISRARLSINALDDGSGVVLDMEREQMITMNASAIRLMQAIAEGSTTPDALADSLSRRYRIGIESARRDVQQFIDETARRIQGK